MTKPTAETAAFEATLALDLASAAGIERAVFALLERAAKTAANRVHADVWGLGERALGAVDRFRQSGNPEALAGARSALGALEGLVR